MDYRYLNPAAKVVLFNLFLDHGLNFGFETSQNPNRQAQGYFRKAEEVRLKTIFENERDYIIQVLAKCNGRIRREDGAAAILKIPPTTLGSKMKKLGIKRNFSV